MQHRADSILEALVNQFVGFVVALATYMWIINPLWNLDHNVAQSTAITLIFTTTSIIRSYIIRRAFDGKTVYQGLKAKFKKENEYGT